ncbi:hypothetical protein [Microbacterium sp. Kw_RZR3]|jgi:hypothetical protein|uniref:hypothetical protein n=1 Tax=unclassified Microbacterium TaxID=2609290 RepID=UPI0023DA1C0D|nr:hypothetical protein [Microbacterium sp. Kw_RZR3]MDF2046666.1 hypothetical protein [Microbacterium sp. Kw_RZR3]
MRRRVIGMLGAAASLTVLLAIGAPATAAVAAYSDPLGTTVTTPLFADCSRVDASGREYARRHGIAVCAANTTPPGVALRTEAVGGEECGALTLTAMSWGRGVAAVEWRASSETGPIDGVDLTVSVSGRAGTTVHRFSGPTGSTPASEGMVTYVGTGLAVVTISGTVETAVAACSLSSAPARIGVR